jgi:hypothetical protein
MCFINKYTQGGALIKIAETPQYQRLEFCIVKIRATWVRRLSHGTLKIQSLTRTANGGGTHVRHAATQRLSVYGHRAKTGHECFVAYQHEIWIEMPIGLNFYKQR